jgi:hypothetical protein
MPGGDAMRLFDGKMKALQSRKSLSPSAGITQH